MSKLVALIKKEFSFYLNSPIAYGIAAFYLIASTLALFIFQHFMLKDIASLRDYFAIIPHLFYIIIPALTMRSWSEERRTGTHELLLTMPFPVWHVVIAKYLSPLILILGILLISMILPLSVMGLGNFDAGIITSQYIGLFFLSSASVAVGTFLSSLSRNQVMAFLGTLSLLAVFTWIDYPTKMMVMPEWLSFILSYGSLNFHYDSFAKGLLDTRDILFFTGISALFLFVTERRIVLAKWSKS